MARRQKKRIAKDVKKDVKKVMNRPKKPSTGKRTGDPITRNINQAQQAGREAALCALDPISGYERGYLPGVCDGDYNSTLRWFSRTKTRLSTKEPVTGIFGAQWLISPTMKSQVLEATSWDSDLVPLTNGAVDDGTYAAAVATVDKIRCVAMMVEIRCFTNPLTLSGTRTIVLGSNSLWEDGMNAVFARKDAYTIGNNKAGEVSRFPWLTSSPPSYVPVTTDANSLSLIQDPCIHVVVFTENADDVFEISVSCIWEALPLMNSLANISPFVGDPSTYSAALQAALQKVPLYSHERISYEDDGVIDSVASDVSTILGAGKAVWNAGKSIVSSVGSMGKTLSGLLGSKADCKIDEDEELLVAAYLKLIDERHVLPTLSSVASSCSSAEQLRSWYEGMLGQKPASHSAAFRPKTMTDYVSLPPLRLARSK